MKLSRNYEFWFVTGSQHLYGPETLEQVASDSEKLVAQLNAEGGYSYKIVYKDTLKTPAEITEFMKKANNEDNCAGIIGWCHTFSPAKMWIKGLSILNKPFLHLHTQFNRDIPWGEIDMDFMNLNQSAHGDREFGFITTRLRMPRKVVVGHFTDKKVQADIGKYMNVAVAISESKNLKVVRFGDNMRFVAVTEGDKVEAEIKFGWEVNGYGIGKLAQCIEEVSDAEVEALYKEYQEKYTILSTDAASVEAIKYQAKIEIALERFLVEGGYGAFTTNFQTLEGLKQLPGLAVQRLMEKGYGFGGEGDWKTAALVRLTKIMGGNDGKGSSFMEDYTYHMEPGHEMVLGAHMLEVCPSIADVKPGILVQPLGIGDREDPARFVFSCKQGNAINASIVDMGGRMRLILNEVDAVKVPYEMPKLPVAQAMWVPQPSLQEGAQAWILAGGAHHTAYTYDVSLEEYLDFAEFMDIETVVINKDTKMSSFRQDLKLSDLLWNFKSK
ncbi:MAG: L-arabinose isomerase [Vallitaleaceae bacterium]|nr:L-arabinose isomerase [Vallitaleaceae bacterium]